MSLNDYTLCAVAVSGVLVLALFYLGALGAERTSTLQKLEATIVALGSDQIRKGLTPATHR
jgi:hypothetical protein